MSFGGIHGRLFSSVVRWNSGHGVGLLIGNVIVVSKPLLFVLIVVLVSLELIPPSYRTVALHSFD